MQNKISLAFFLTSVKEYPSNLVDTISNNVIRFTILLLTGISVISITLKILNHDVNSDPHSLFTKIVKSTWGCAYETKNKYLQKYSESTKSSEYNILLSKEENVLFVKTCFITRWHMIHFIGHIVLGLLFPMFWFFILASSFSFEIWEYFNCNCHDITDIFVNCLGVFIGVSISKLL